MTVVNTGRIKNIDFIFKPSHSNFSNFEISSFAQSGKKNLFSVFNAVFDFNNYTAFTQLQKSQ